MEWGTGVVAVKRSILRVPRQKGRCMRKQGARRPIQMLLATTVLSVGGFEANAQTTQLGTINVEATSPAPGNYTVPRTTTGTKTDTPLRDIPQSITVITKQQVQDIGAQKLEDVVRYVPGVNWHQGENNRDQIVIRGQNSTADFFVNGMRDDGQVFRDLYNADRIEVLKGSNAMIFGRGGGGGVLNRVLKEADGIRINEWKFQGGAYDNKRVSTDVGGKLSETFAARINAVYEDTKSYRDFYNMERAGINPTFTWTPSANTRVKFSYEYFRDFRTADRGIPSQLGFPYPGAAPSTFFGNPAVSFTPQTQNIAMLAFAHEFNNSFKVDRKSTRLNSSHIQKSRMPSSA